MTFDINKVIVVDLDGNPMGVTTLGKEVGNLIYRKTSTIEWLEVSKNIHRSLPVELTNLELTELLQIITDPSCTFILAAKDALTQYITELIK